MCVHVEVCVHVCVVCVFMCTCVHCVYVCKAKELPESTTDVVCITMSDQLAVDMRIAHW